MLQQLAALIKQQAQTTVIENPDIPNHQNEAVMALAGDSVLGGLQNALGSGGIKDVLQMFTGMSNVNNSPVTQNIAASFIQNLVGKLGIGQQQASGIAQSLIPSILSGLVSKTNDSADNGFNMQGLFNQLSGGKAQGFDVQGLLGKFTQGGLDKDGDGDTDMQDIMKMFGK
jgi:hypothetical protein